MREPAEGSCVRKASATPWQALSQIKRLASALRACVLSTPGAVGLQSPVAVLCVAFSRSESATSKTSAIHYSRDFAASETHQPLHEMRVFPYPIAVNIKRLGISSQTVTARKQLPANGLAAKDSVETFPLRRRRDPSLPSQRAGPVSGSKTKFKFPGAHV